MATCVTEVTRGTRTDSALLYARVEGEPATRVRVGRSTVGGEGLAIIAGPCAVEDDRQLLKVAGQVALSGATVLRGGTWKPRTSPYAFQGLGEEGLHLLVEARARCGLPIVTEVVSEEHVSLVAAHADMLQIGARNMFNYALLRIVARAGKPILLKRGFQATIDEFLLSAEYLLSEGNDQVILCERGVRGMDTKYTRNILDLSAIPVLKQETHLPIIVDPSHATGRSDLVAPMAKAAIAAGADGLLIEVHPQPETARCDGPQSLSPVAFARLVEELRPLADLMGRRMAPSPVLVDLTR